MVDGTQLRAAQVVDRERAAAVCDFAQLLADQMLGAVPLSDRVISRETVKR